MNKKLKYFKYNSGGGLIDERDFKRVNLEMTYDKYSGINCCISIGIGDITIEKKFNDNSQSITNKYFDMVENHPILSKFYDMINTFDFDKLEANFNWMTSHDVEIDDIYYQFEDSDIKHVQYPNNNGLLQLINDFIYGYLLEDDKIKAMVKALYEKDEFNLHNLKKIANQTRSFDENKKYDLDTFLKDDIKIDSTKKEDIPDEDKDKLFDLYLNKINKKLEEIKKEEENMEN